LSGNNLTLPVVDEPDSGIEHPLRSQVSSRQQSTQFISQNWIWIFVLVYGLYVWLPFLAPILMKIGWSSAGQYLYWFYSFFCHQLPERSFFLFGHKTMYSLSEIQLAWKNTLDPIILRQFTGNPAMGWKVAWSDRMVSMYNSIWLFGLLWWPFRQRIKPLPLWGFILLCLPMAIDGSTHFISDLAGIEQGFRQTNLWLVTLTHGGLPTWFYAGNALGSFNSWMRLITGVLFGLGLVWFGFPFLGESFGSVDLQEG
jgi:uncharacterized membrane protein